MRNCRCTRRKTLLATGGAARLAEELRLADGIHRRIAGLSRVGVRTDQNALDYVEDLRDDERSYFDGLAVGCIATGAGCQAIVATLHQLRTIAHALRGWPTPLGAAINATHKVFNESDDVVDERSRFQLETVAKEVLQFTNFNLAASAMIDA